MGTTTGSIVETQIGAGRFLIAPVGAVEPTDVTTAWDAGWTELGLTTEGGSNKYELTIEDVMVEEILDPVRGITTKRLASVIFTLAQVTMTNLSRAMNGGDVETATGITTFEPPEMGGEVYHAIGWESNDNTERWVWRRCLQAGSIETKRRNKTADLAAIPCEFHAYGVDGQQPFKVWGLASVRA